MSLVPFTGFASSFNLATRWSQVLSMPFFMLMGFAPAVTAWSHTSQQSFENEGLFPCPALWEHPPLLRPRCQVNLPANALKLEALHYQHTCKPKWIISRARTEAVVVPSPAASFVRPATYNITPVEAESSFWAQWLSTNPRTCFTYVGKLSEELQH